MTGSRAKQLTARGWAYIPAASGPVGGGLIKLGRGSTQAAVAVGLAPYAIWALLLIVFVIGYLAALTRYLRTKPDQQDAERLIAISANAVVSILTLSVATIPVPAVPAPSPCRGHCTLASKTRAASPAPPPRRNLARGASRRALASGSSRPTARRSKTPQVPPPQQLKRR